MNWSPWADGPGEYISGSLALKSKFSHPRYREGLR